MVYQSYSIFPWRIYLYMQTIEREGGGHIAQDWWQSCHFMLGHIHSLIGLGQSCLHLHLFVIT